MVQHCQCPLAPAWAIGADGFIIVPFCTPAYNGLKKSTVHLIMIQIVTSRKVAGISDRAGNAKRQVTDKVAR